MSTMAYADMTNKRETSTGPMAGVRTYVDAFAALVPSEVLALHSLVISVTTKTEQQTYGEGQVWSITAIPPEAVQALSFSFWGLFVLSWVLYAMPRYLGGQWDRFDWLRAAIAPCAFTGWTMLQRATAFDAAFPHVPDATRTVIALFLGAILGSASAILAGVAAAKQPPAPPLITPP